MPLSVINVLRYNKFVFFLFNVYSADIINKVFIMYSIIRKLFIILGNLMVLISVKNYSFCSFTYVYHIRMIMFCRKVLTIKLNWSL